MAKVSTLLSISELKSLFTPSLLLELREYSKAEHGEYVFKLFFESIYSCINNLCERGEYSVQNFLPKKYDPDGPIFHFFSTKNINYQFMLSAAYKNYDVGTHLNCDGRFIDLFNFNFPKLTFNAIDRPSKPKNDVS